MKLDEEEFNHIAYAYRATPCQFPTEVSARYDELVEYTKGLILEAIKQERERCANVCEHTGDTIGECPEMAGYCADAIRARSDEA